MKSMNPNGRTENMDNITLNIRRKETHDFTGWVITCPEASGLLIFGSNLSEELAKVPVALELLDRARSGQ